MEQSKLDSQRKVVLPVAGERNVLITSALPYVNNVPHLGNIIGCVLSADVFARYCRLRGYNTLFICGTDEYGTATETKALQEGLTPREICDKYHQIHKEIYEWFGAEFDLFGRTSTEWQTTIAQDIFHKIYARKYLEQLPVDQLWCPICQRYLSDRYIEGTCPKCQYNDARGDQCDGCSTLLNATELIDPKCKICKDRIKKEISEGKPASQFGKLELRKEQHLFLDLPKLEEQISNFVKKSSAEGWSANGIALTKGWLTSGLKSRCITRDLKWGIPVPLEGFENKVFYVWFDAPIGYISITANYTDKWELWWKNPDQVQLIQFMGKDNTPFHTVMFPASLLATGEKWTLLDRLSTTEYLNYEGSQFSKSRGVGVFGDGAKITNVPQETWRYYLLANRPETSDSEFLWTDFVAKNNNELLANLGNFCNRGLSFLQAHCESTLPETGSLTEVETSLITKIDAELKEYVTALENQNLREGLKIAMNISRLGNQYYQDAKFWTLFRTDRIRCNTIVSFGVNLTYALAVILLPFLPTFSEKLLEQLGDTQRKEDRRIPLRFDHTFFKPGHKIGTAFPLIQEIPAGKAQEWKERFGPWENDDHKEACLKKWANVVSELKPSQPKQHKKQRVKKTTLNAELEADKKKDEANKQSQTKPRANVALSPKLTEAVIEAINALEQELLKETSVPVEAFYDIDNSLNDPLESSSLNPRFLSATRLPPYSVVLASEVREVEGLPVKVSLVRRNYVVAADELKKAGLSDKDVLQVQQWVASRDLAKFKQTLASGSGKTTFLLDGKNIELAEGKTLFASAADLLKPAKK